MTLVAVKPCILINVTIFVGKKDVALGSNFERGHVRPASKTWHITKAAEPIYFQGQHLDINCRPI